MTKNEIFDLRLQIMAMAERYFSIPGLLYECGVEEIDDGRVSVTQVLRDSIAGVKRTFTSEVDTAVTIAQSVLKTMAVRIGAVSSDPPKDKVQVMPDGKVYLNGQALKSLSHFTYEASVDAQPTVTLRSVAAFTEMDLDILPEHLRFEVTGLREALAMLQELSDYRNEQFQDRAYAMAHSSTQEVELYRKLNDIVRRYTPSG